MITVKIITLVKELKSVSEKVVQILNNNQDSFNYEYINDSQIIQELEGEKVLIADKLYDKYETLRNRLEGDKTNLLGLTDKQLANDFYSNLFGDLKKVNGIPNGNGVITIYQVKEIIKEIPIEAYLVYEFICCPLLIVTRKNLYHDEERICPFDKKISKYIMYDVLKHSKICPVCSKEIYQSLDRLQLESMDGIFSIIGFLANKKINLDELLKKQNNSQNILKKNCTLEQIKELIIKDNLRKAIKELLKLLEGNRIIEKELEMISLSSQLEHLTRKERMNTVFGNELLVERNKIRTSLLELFYEIKNYVSN